MSSQVSEKLLAGDLRSSYQRPTKKLPVSHSQTSLPFKKWRKQPEKQQAVLVLPRLNGTRVLTAGRLKQQKDSAGSRSVPVIFLQREQHAYFTAILHQQVGVFLSICSSARVH